MLCVGGVIPGCLKEPEESNRTDVRRLPEDQAIQSVVPRALHRPPANINVWLPEDQPDQGPGRTAMKSTVQGSMGGTPVP